MREAKSEYYVPLPPAPPPQLIASSRAEIPSHLKVIGAGRSDGAHSSVRFRKVVKL